MIHEILAKSVLIKHKKIDSWFLSRYGMNLYRGCTHNCAYCDGRAEGYYVDGVFGEDVSVKINASEILKKELDPARKRKPMLPGVTMIGGGVCDSYQSLELKYELTRKALGIINQYGLPVHMLTKSTHIKRDSDLLEEINKNSKAIISFSFSSVNDEIGKIVEPGVPLPSERLKTISYFKSKGFTCGIYLMPIIPFITDSVDKLEDVFRKAKESGVDFIVFAGMTLKEGRQKEYLINVVRKFFPELIDIFSSIYNNSRWGEPSKNYIEHLNKIVYEIAQSYKIPFRLPVKFVDKFLSENDRIVLILEHIDYLLKLKGQKCYLGYAAYQLSQLREPISSINRLTDIKGIGPDAERLIKEIIHAKSCQLLNSLYEFN
jgi:DNA repair photolyase